MKLVRIVMQQPDGKPFAGGEISLSPIEPAGAGAPGKVKTDPEGVARFRVGAGTFRIGVSNLPTGSTLPKYGTMVRVEEVAEGLEQIVRLVKAS
ncbi:MAG: hypothetical protein HYX90_12035 [Chloroflexi bacterium]|nr:hypothetical protein [Chloroflexota bacterium]